MNSNNELKENELMSPMLLSRPLLFTSPVAVEMMVGLVVVLEKGAAKSRWVNIVVCNRLDGGGEEGMRQKKQRQVFIRVT